MSIRQGKISIAGAPKDATWGSIEGTITDQLDLKNELAKKLESGSPSFTGTPTAPTAAVGTSNDQIATTKFVDNAIAAAGSGLPSQEGHAGQYLTTNGTAASWNTVDALPTQTGMSGKYLTTDGTTASWNTVDSLPSQSGQSGKYLTTNGTTASWSTVDALPSQSGQSGKFLTTNGTTASWADNIVTTDTTQSINASAVKTFNGRVNFIGTGDSNAVYISTDTRFDVYGTSCTILGFSSGTFLINHPNYGLNLRGSGARPNYNGNSMALYSDTTDKAPLASPALTGTPTAPTASAGTSTTQIATTAFVGTAISNYNPFPTQAGHSGEFLTTNGTTVSWATATVEGDGTTITTNSSNKLQANGVIDKKTGNATYDWTGTLAEYEALGTYDSNWTYFITDDYTSGSSSVSVDNRTINKNTNSRLQTIGVINKADSDKVIDTWVGTSSEWNDGGTKEYYNWSQLPLSTWSSASIPHTSSWGNILYNNGVYIIAGTGSSNYAYATDINSWQTKTFSSGINWQKGTVSGNNFVLLTASTVSSPQKAIYSTDGLNWTTVNLPSTYTISWNQVRTLNNKIVAVGSSSSGTVYAYSSDNGLSWSFGTNLPISRNWRSIAYGNGTYVMTCTGTEILYSTDDMATWNQADTSASSSTGIRWVVYGDGKFVTLTSYGSEVGISTDGINWTFTNNRKSTYISDLQYDGTVFVGVDVDDKAYFYSSDGSDWTMVACPIVGSYWCYGNFVNGKYVLQSYSDATIAIHEGSFFNYYTTDRTPTTDSTLYTSPSETSSKYIKSASSSSIVLSDNATYTYNERTTLTGNVGVIYPNALSYITNSGKIKIGDKIIADKVLNSNDKIDAYRLASDYGDNKVLSYSNYALTWKNGVFTDADNTFTGANTFSGTTILAPTTYLAASGGYEGGEIKFKSGDSEVNTGKDMNLDRYNGKFRFFGQDSGGTTKVLLQLDMENDSASASSGVKSSIVGWGMPDYSAGVSLSGWTTSNTNFTVNYDGIIYVKIISVSALESFYVDDIIMCSLSNVSSYTGTAVGFLPIVKGTHTFRTSSTTSRINSVIFYPFKGEV